MTRKKPKKLTQAQENYLTLDGAPVAYVPRLEISVPLRVQCEVIS